MRRAYNKKHETESYEKVSYKVGDCVQHFNIRQQTSKGRKLEPTWKPVNGFYVVCDLLNGGRSVILEDPTTTNTKIKRDIEHVRPYPGFPKHISRARGKPKLSKKRRGRKRKRFMGKIL